MAGRPALAGAALLLTLALGGCDMLYGGPERQPEPAYCYRTLGKVDCYAHPDPVDVPIVNEERSAAAFQPPP